MLSTIKSKDYVNIKTEAAGRTDCHKPTIWQKNEEAKITISYTGCGRKVAP